MIRKCDDSSSFCVVLSADGSDWQQTDVEDQRSRTTEQRLTEKTQASNKGQNKGFVYRTAENPAKPDHTPIYIIKDMVLNQVKKFSRNHYSKMGSVSCLFWDFHC